MFVPLKLAFPDATIPVVQLSLLASMDAKVYSCSLCMPCLASACESPYCPYSIYQQARKASLP